MCGIVGYFKSELDNRSIILSMAKTIEHRGPDDEGFVFANISDKNIHTFSSGKSPKSIRHSFAELREGVEVPPHHLAMAQVRFSIIDLSAHGHQPMWSKCGRYCITFNGEIYNFIELREQLKCLGRIFHTDSDTEVLLQSYIEWGDTLFDRINGFFAFAIYDVERRQVLLGRDRLGKAHLYVTQDSKSVYWASEIKALIQAQQVNINKINLSSVSDFILYGHRDRKGTFWHDVLDFPPGHFAWIGKEGIVKPIRYWSFPTERKTTKEISFNEAVVGFRNVLTDALAIRLRADVPIGFELSGGMDSSALVGLAAGALGKEIKTFTVKFDEPRWNEEPYARAVADKYKKQIDYNVIAPPEGQFWDGANDFVWQQEEPFHAPNLYTSQSLQKKIKSLGASVVISGAGGDEVLAGYPIEYYTAYLRHLLSNNKYIKFLSELKKSSDLTASQIIKKLLLEIAFNDEKISQIIKFKSGESGVIDKILSPSIKDNVISDPLLSRNNSFNDAVIANLSHRLMNYWLRSGMKSSYAIPIEPRSPFLDYRVVEFCATLPPEYLINDGWHKYLLRKAVEIYLPIEVTWRRRKMGFPFPYNSWLKAHKKLIIYNLKKSECPYFDYNSLVENYDNLNSVAPTTLWRIISVGLWWVRVVNGRKILLTGY